MPVLEECLRHDCTALGTEPTHLVWCDGCNKYHLLRLCKEHHEAYVRKDKELGRLAPV